MAALILFCLVARRDSGDADAEFEAMLQNVYFQLEGWYFVETLLMSARSLAEADIQVAHQRATRGQKNIRLCQNISCQTLPLILYARLTKPKFEFHMFPLYFRTIYIIKCE